MRSLKFIAAALVGAIAVTGSASGQQTSREIERLADLGQIWAYADLFNPYVGSGDVDWDAALIEAIPAVRRARTDDEYFAALNAMLARSGDPNATIVEEAQTRALYTAPEALPPPVRIEDGVAYAHCSAIANAIGSQGADANAVAAEIAGAPRGAIIDCRTPHGNFIALRSALNAIARTRISAPLASGGAMVRAYSGFPPQGSASSGGYSTGMNIIEDTPLDPLPRATQSTSPLVFMVDIGTTYVLAPIAALQAADLARVVGTGEVADGAIRFSAGGRDVYMSRGIYVYPNGSVGFAADALISRSDNAAALRIAMEQLSAPPALRPVQARPLRRAPNPYAGDAAPPVEQRLLALYRMWGVIDSFHAYKSLIDTPWQSVLAEFVPIFLAADTRAKYEAAVLQLAARTQDTHSAITGLTASQMSATLHRPGIYARFVENKLIVTGYVDAALAQRVAIGDEIVAVDGEPVSAIAARLTPLIAYSTPQALSYALPGRILAGPPGSEAALTLRTADGRTRRERIVRVPVAPRVNATPIWRMLDGNVGYIDLERLPRQDADRAVDELINARALILDLRGYPQGAAWVLAPRFARHPDPIVAARFRRPIYTDTPLGEQTWATFDQIIPPLGDRTKYTGPIFVLIDDRAISQSEHTGLFLEAAADVTFVGSPTNGTDGDVTTLYLPGNLTFRFTGHDVSWPDGRQLQRRGIQPDVPVTPTIAGVRAGRDEILEAALTLARR